MVPSMEVLLQASDPLATRLWSLLRMRATCSQRGSVIHGVSRMLIAGMVRALPSGKLSKKLWKITKLFMGKLTISTGPCYSSLFVCLPGRVSLVFDVVPMIKTIQKRAPVQWGNSQDP